MTGSTHTCPQQPLLLPEQHLEVFSMRPESALVSRTTSLANTMQALGQHVERVLNWRGSILECLCPAWCIVIQVWSRGLNRTARRPGLLPNSSEYFVFIICGTYRGWVLSFHQVQCSWARKGKGSRRKQVRRLVNLLSLAKRQNRRLHRMRVNQMIFQYLHRSWRRAFWRSCKAGDLDLLADQGERRW